MARPTSLEYRLKEIIEMLMEKKHTTKTATPIKSLIEILEEI